MTNFKAPRRLNLVGHTYGNLLVLALDHIQKYATNSATFWLVECTCGTTKVVKGNHLRTGQTTTCGNWSNHTRAERNDSSGHYNAVHDRTVRLRGKASKYACDHDCGYQAADWAHIHGTDPTDSMNYMPLCRPCHLIYDHDQEN